MPAWTTTTDQIRKPRADAVRNRERVLEAAKIVFNAGGPEASLEAVAKRAGVGIGTLYRHFPTREDLFEAVYRREVEQLSELAEQLKNAKDPVDALRRWLRSNVEFVATKKGMSAALALPFQSSSELAAFSMDRLTKAIGSLLDRAVAAGADARRCQPGGFAPGPRRHVLHARPARLAILGAADARRLRRRAARAAGREGATGAYHRQAGEAASRSGSDRVQGASRFKSVWATGSLDLSRPGRVR